jgi:hypothetical protein
MAASFAVHIRRQVTPTARVFWSGAVWLLLAASLAGRAPAQSAPVVPDSVRVFNADPLFRPSADGKELQGAEPIGPIELLAPRNGICSGQVILTSGAAFAGLSAKAGDLKASSGGTISANAIRVRYADVSQTYMPLLSEPPGNQTVLPVWVTVTVPPDAAPGLYKGSLAINLRRPLVVPVNLTVYAWKLGDPHEWATWVNLLQSPESVAGHYKVPLWSERHFQLLEKSLALMGHAGNHILGVNCLAKTVFGDDPIIVFKKAGHGYAPESKFLERYLTLYNKHAGAPRFLAVHVWDYSMYRSGQTRDGGKEEWTADAINAVELQGDRLVPLQLPIHGKPGSEELWGRVMDGIRACMKKLGWEKTRLLLGTGGDNWPGPGTVELFRKVAPEAQWRVLTHGGGSPKWGVSPEARTQPNGMITGCHESARRLPNFRVKVPGQPVTCNSRDHVGTHPGHFRALAPVLCFIENHDGFCWKGLDYWSYPGPDGKQRSALNTYLHFGNMVGGTPRAICAPGPDGALATVQFEMLREGIQDCEAMFSIRRDLKIICPPPVRECDLIELFLSRAVAQPGRDKVVELGIRLYFDGDRIGAIPHAPLYNTGRHSGQARLANSADGQVFEIDVTLGDDPWIKGGKGSYTVRLKREGDKFTGTHTGTYEGRSYSGSVKGAFIPKGIAVPTGEPAVESELSRQGEAVIKETAAALDRSPRSYPRKGEVPAVLARLYAAASRIAEAAEAQRRRQAGPRP